MIGLVFLFPVILAAEEYKIVETRHGPVRGKRLDSYGGQSGFVFAGIPHAKPPVGPLRFREPEEPHPWSEVLETFQYRNACLSDPIKTYKVAEGNAAGPVSEDCLYLNVFSSKSCLEKGGCAVMVVIHGGVFKCESPVIFHMDTIVNNFANEERNVVVVTIPYRYGVIGYFHLTDDFETSLDANVGTKDAIYALKWIQREVAAFGGNPKRVTLFGHSAGALLTQHLALLPSTEGLFHQYIAQSGPFNEAMEDTRVLNIPGSRALAELSGCAKAGELYNEKHRVDQIIDCMRSVSDRVLLNSTLRLDDRVEETSWSWLDGPEGIFPATNHQLLKNPRRLPCMIGTTSAEFRDARNILDAKKKVNMTRLIEFCSYYAYLRGYHEPEKFVRSCTEFYGKEGLTQYADDHLLFYLGVHQVADAFSKTGADVFVYNYDYWGAGKAFKKYTDNKDYLGPGHSEEYIYVFGLHRDETQMTAKDYLVEYIWTALISNFVNTGDPSYNGQKWETWSPEKKNYFLVDFDGNMQMPGNRNGYYLEAVEFWEHIIPKEVGSFTALTAFPTGIDCVSNENVISNILSFWLGTAQGHDKHYNASIAHYHLWDDYIRQKRKDFLTKRLIHRKAGNVSVDLGEELVRDEADGINWLTLSLAVAVVVLVGYIVFMKFTTYRRRKNYDAFH